MEPQNFLVHSPLCMVYYEFSGRTAPTKRITAKLIKPITKPTNKAQGVVSFLKLSRRELNVFIVCSPQMKISEYHLEHKLHWHRSFSIVKKRAHEAQCTFPASNICNILIWQENNSL